MTEAYEDKYVIKMSPGEVKFAIERLEAKYSPCPHFVVRPYGLGFDDQSAAETVIDDLQFNREGKTEMQLEVNAFQANIAAPSVVEARSRLA